MGRPVGRFLRKVWNRGSFGLKRAFSKYSSKVGSSFFSPAAVSAVDLFSFGYDGKILDFAVPNYDPVAATIRDSEAETIALNWAVRFYGAQDVKFDGVELRTQPARFWLVRLASNFGPAHLMLYAVVLPGGSIVVPTIREWLGVDVMQNLEFASHYQLWFDRVDLLRNLGRIFGG